MIIVMHVLAAIYTRRHTCAVCRHYKQVFIDLLINS